MDVQLRKTSVTENYQESFDKQTALQPADALSGLRKQAVDNFAELGFPTTRNEDWKYTNLLPLVKEFMPPAAPGEFNNQTTVQPFELVGVPASRLVFVDGVYAPSQSILVEDIKGLVITTLGEALQNIAYASIIERYIGARNTDKNALLALNTAFAWEGAFVSIPDNAALQHPVLLNFIITEKAQGHSLHTANVLVAGANSQATIIEAYQHAENGNPLINTSAHFHLKDNAVVHFHKLHSGNPDHFFVSNTFAKLDRSATFNALHVNLSGLLVRNNVTVDLDGPGAHADLKGLYALDAKEHADNHVVVKHNSPNCTSNQLYKGLMDGQSTGVFNGRIYVAIDAQKTNAFQSNKNVLLSPDANSYSKPQLEIFADDVKCSHGSTTGQIDKTALFYLQARGIDKSTALAMLNEAFAADVFKDIALEPLKNWLQNAVSVKLHSENLIY